MKPGRLGPHGLGLVGIAATSPLEIVKLRETTDVFTQGPELAKHNDCVHTHIID